MACTKALSDFSCGAPALPGLINSRMIESTLGGGTVSCAIAMPRPPTSRYNPNSNPVIFFIDADLLGRELSGSNAEGPESGEKRSTRSRAETIPKQSRSQAVKSCASRVAVKSSHQELPVKSWRVRWRTGVHA